MLKSLITQPALSKLYKKETYGLCHIIEATVNFLSYSLRKLFTVNSEKVRVIHATCMPY